MKYNKPEIVIKILNRVDMLVASQQGTDDPWKEDIY